MKIKRWWTKRRLGTLSSFIAAAVVLLIQAETARAQWTGPDTSNNIYYNSGNAGNVGARGCPLTATDWL
jgi:hypothetical protein